MKIELNDKYVAHHKEAFEWASFKTFKEAESWLKEYDAQDGIAESTEHGGSYIAKITHRSSVEKTDFKENYCECDLINGVCECGKHGEEWPYDSDYEWVGVVKYLPVNTHTEPILKISDGWVINPKSAKDESEDVVYLILVEADSLPLIGTYADNYGYFSTTNEMINIKNVYAIKEFKYPTLPTRDNESVV